MGCDLNNAYIGYVKITYFVLTFFTNWDSQGSSCVPMTAKMVLLVVPKSVKKVGEFDRIIL